MITTVRVNTRSGSPDTNGLGGSSPERRPPSAQKPIIDRKKVEAKLAVAEAEVERLRRQIEDTE
jgi:hypothetical protein